MVVKNTDGDSLIELESLEFEGRSHVGVFPWVYLFGIAAAEIVIGYFNIHVGMILHILFLTAILCRAVFSLYRPELSGTEDGHSYHFYLSLALVPLIRILSLSIPLKTMPLQYWYFFVGVPILTAAWLVIKRTEFRWRDIYLCFGKSRLSWRSISLQLAIGLVGFLLGLIEFYILQPPQLPPLTWGETLLLVVILLLFVGFTEELIFRGILRKAADDFLGKELSVVYVSLIFASLSITHLSFAYIFFAFGTAVIFTLITYRTESLLGIALAHGFAAVTFLIIAPQLLA